MTLEAYAESWILSSERQQMMGKECSSIDWVLAWHSRLPGFNPQHCIKPCEKKNNKKIKLNKLTNAKAARSQARAA